MTTLDERFEEKFNAGDFVELYTKNHIDTLIKDLKSFIHSELKDYKERVMAKLNGMMFVDTYESGQFRMHADGYNQALEEAINEINKLDI